MRPLSPRGQFDSRQSFMPGELAVLLRVDVRTLRGWAEHGQVACVPTSGGHRRYYRPRLPFLPPSGDPQLLTVNETAAELGVTPSTVWRWVLGNPPFLAPRVYSVQLPNGARRLWRSDVDARRMSVLL